MNELLQRYLDGELTLDELPAELRVEARRWEARADALRAQGPAGMPAGLGQRILRSVEGESTVSAWRRALAWWLRPRAISLSPVAVALGGAAALFFALAPWRDGPVTGGAVAGGPTVESGQPAALDVFVEFVLEAPEATSVAVAGDFTTWSPQVVLEDVDGDGVWSGRFRVEPGVHQYMFVVDGSRWVTDPRALRHVDDGFGNRNAVLVVPAGPAS